MYCYCKFTMKMIRKLLDCYIPVIKFYKYLNKICFIHTCITLVIRCACMTCLIIVNPETKSICLFGDIGPLLQVLYCIKWNGIIQVCLLWNKCNTITWQRIFLLSNYYNYIQTSFSIFQDVFTFFSVFVCDNSTYWFCTI